MTDQASGAGSSRSAVSNVRPADCKLALLACTDSTRVPRKNPAFPRCDQQRRNQLYRFGVGIFITYAVGSLPAHPFTDDQEMPFLIKIPDDTMRYIAFEM